MLRLAAKPSFLSFGRDFVERLAAAAGVDNLRFAADAGAPAGIRLPVETIKSRIDMPGFRIDTPQRALAAIAAAARGTELLPCSSMSITRR